MKKPLLLCVLAVLALSACSQKSAEQKVAEQVKEKQHALTAEERSRAEINAKNFYNKPCIEASGANGQFNECKPSDSNFNGLVTCSGMVPQASGTYKEVVRYCGYTPELVGCSSEDTVK